MKLFQEGEPFPGPRFQGSCLTLGNKLSKRHTCWQSKRLYWEWVPGQRAAGWGNQENCSAMRLTISSIMGMRLVSRLSLWLVVLPGPYLVCPRVLLGGACTSQPGCIPAPRILGRFVVSFPPIGPSQILPIGLQGSTTFLIRASGCETIHTSGYYHVCSTWAVSVNDPLTKL